MKQVKILKRPSASPPPKNPIDRVSSEITALLDSALSRERSRLEATYRARQDALLRAISSVLNDTLERVILTSAKRETDALVASFAKLVANHALPEFDTDLPAPKPSPQMIAETRAAFISSFEKGVIPSFEAAVRSMLKGFAGVVDKQLEECLVGKVGGVASVVEGVADKMREVKNEVKEIAVSERLKNEQKDIEAVEKALEVGDVKHALMLCLGKSDAVQAKAINGALDRGETPDKAFDGDVPERALLVCFAALLSNDLGDRTEVRLSWLYELVTLMDDVEEGGEEDGVTRGRLESTIEKLVDFHKNGNLASSDAKHVKLLIRVFKTHLNAM